MRKQTAPERGPLLNTDIPGSILFITATSAGKALPSPLAQYPFVPRLFSIIKNFALIYIIYR